jgi:hypothetical protein
MCPENKSQKIVDRINDCFAFSTETLLQTPLKELTISPDLEVNYKNSAHTIIDKLVK